MKRLQDSKPSDDFAVLDLKGALKRLGGREYIYRKIVQKFMSEFGQAHEVIINYLAAGDMASAKRTAHSLKGAAASIGAMALFQVSADAEKAISGKEADWQEALAQMKDELKNVHSAINAYLDKPSRSAQLSASEFLLMP